MATRKSLPNSFFNATGETAGLPNDLALLQEEILNWISNREEMSSKELEKRIETLSNEISQIRELLQKSFSYAERDAQASLGKCRNILEQSVENILNAHGISFKPNSSLHHRINLLRSKGHVEKRITQKMLSIKDMANLGVHGETVTSKDALDALDSLCDILEWQNGIKQTRPQRRTLGTKAWIGLAFGTLLIGSFIFYLTSPRSFSEEDARKFAEDFQSASTTNNIKKTTSFYADEAMVFKEKKSKETIGKNWRKFIESRPTRVYTIHGPVEVEKTGKNKFEVTYREKFTAMHPKKDDSKGIWRTELVIQAINDSLKIVAMDGEIEEREPLNE